MRKQKKTICVYSSAADGNSPIFKKVAIELGTKLAKAGFRVVNGGGQAGLMGHVTKNAMENGGDAIGIIPDFLADKENISHELTEVFVTENMHERKKLMMLYADAFVILPGGVGTLEEFFETLAWRTLGLHEKPIILFNINNIWGPLLGLLEHIQQNGFCHTNVYKEFHIVDNVDDIFKIIN